MFYLAIPPSLFDDVSQSLRRSGCAQDGRVVVEKPLGRDLESARELGKVLSANFAEENVFRIDHYLGKEPVQNLMYFRFCERVARAVVEPKLYRQRPDNDGGVLWGRRTRCVLRRGGRGA